MNWLSWDNLSHRKEGGLGFRNLRWFTLAMLAKQGSRVEFLLQTMVSSRQIFLSQNISYWKFLHLNYGSQSKLCLERDMECKAYTRDGMSVKNWRRLIYQCLRRPLVS